jgi:hypothetical protein
MTPGEASVRNGAKVGAITDCPIEHISTAWPATLTERCGRTRQQNAEAGPSVDVGFRVEAPACRGH